MPKLIVLFHAGDNSAASLAENVAVGARGVRFTEVDIRAVGNAEQTSGQRQRRLDSSDQLRDYDSVVVACSSADHLPIELDRMLDDLEGAPTSQFTNTVFTVLGAERSSLFSRVAGLGGIVVSPARGIDDASVRASAAGARAARVVGWVRHALSHEQHDHHAAHAHHDHDDHHHQHEHRPPA